MFLPLYARDYSCSFLRLLLSQCFSLTPQLDVLLPLHRFRHSPNIHIPIHRTDSNQNSSTLIFFLPFCWFCDYSSDTFSIPTSLTLSSSIARQLPVMTYADYPILLHVVQARDDVVMAFSKVLVREYK